jgi:hypothetical protein
LCVRNALAKLKLPEGGYRKVWCPSPIAGEEQVQLFLNTDKAPSQMAADFHFRALKRAVKGVRDEPGYLGDARDQLVSFEYRPIVQILPNRGGDGYKVVWHRPAANALFTAIQQEEITAAYTAAAAASVTPRG